MAQRGRRDGIRRTSGLRAQACYRFSLNHVAVGGVHPHIAVTVNAATSAGRRASFCIAYAGKRRGPGMMRHVAKPIDERAYA